jgi:hypothetical protein
MLAKCANPECSHVFRYFGTGKLYRLTGRQQHRANPRAAVEHFWLCADCSPKMTIAVEPDGKSVVIPRAFVPVYREVVGRVSWVPEINPVLAAWAEAAAQSHAV